MSGHRAMGAHHSAAAITTTWLTPLPIIDALGGAASFDLDPCAAPAPRPWDTARHMNAEADGDGLALDWWGRVFLNSPYGAALDAWLGKLADHGQGTALIFARTETEAFFRQVWGRASGLLFLEGRLHFHFPDGSRAKANAGAPSVLCAYGQDDLDRLAGSPLAGKLIPLLFPRYSVVAALDVTWREAVLGWVRQQRGPIALDDLYRALQAHPKARGNTHWRAKVRQTLQRGPFERVGAGVWAAQAGGA